MDALLAERREAPRVEVLVLQADLGQSQVLDDAGVPDHDVRAGAAVHPVAGEALDGRHRAADDGVALDDLDVEAGAGQVAGGDQAVVAGADDDGAVAGVAHRVDRSSRQPEDGERPRVAGEAQPRTRSTQPPAR